MKKIQVGPVRNCTRIDFQGHHHYILQIPSLLGQSGLFYGEYDFVLCFHTLDWVMSQINMHNYFKTLT